MTVFKTYLKVLNRYKFTVILYTALLVGFAAINNTAGTGQQAFEARKPNVYIEDLDNSELSKDFIRYMDTKCELSHLEKEYTKDALFYRQLDYYLTIPKNFEKDILASKNPEIQVEKTGDFASYYANMLSERYIKTVQVYASTQENVSALIKDVKKNLDTQTKVHMETTLDKASIRSITNYYNFAAYSLLAGVMYIIGLVMTTFKREEIQKRMVVSATKQGSIQVKLWLCNVGYALVLWASYVGISYVICGKIVFSQHGLYYILNSFLYLLCATSLAFFVASLLKSREAINGIVNVVALGSAFLCGAFLSVNLLPEFVLKIAHVLPAYWYIQTNEFLRGAEVINTSALQVMYPNMMMLVFFTALFFGLTILTSKMRTRF